MVAEDGTRSDMEFLCRIVEAVIKPARPPSIFPTRSAYGPEEYTSCMRTLIERVPNSDKAVFSVHCHNDLGMAVANSLANRRRRRRSNAPSTIGERQAMPALEEVVKAINVRNDSSVLEQDAPHADVGAFERCRPATSFRCSTTRRSSAATRSPMKPASIRTAC